MCKPMTDERLEELLELIEAPGVEELYLEANELLTEVRRLRAEAIVWHPWPGETPKSTDNYLVTCTGEGTIKYTYMDWFDADAGTWVDESFGTTSGFTNDIIRWAEMPAPDGGE